MELDAKAFKKILPEDFYGRFLSKGVRPDGRGLLTPRKTNAISGSVSTADGSCLVKMGNTSVLAGVKAEVCAPEEHAPTAGFLVVNVDLPPLCSPEYERGRPSEKTQVLTRHVSSLLHAAGAVDLEGLCIEEGALVWVLYLDVVCLVDDGNVLDAATVAAFLALRDVRLPNVVIDDDGLARHSAERPNALTVAPMRVSCSFALFGGYVLSDPTHEEEGLADTVFSVVADADGTLHEVHKAGGVPVAEDVLRECIALAQEQASLIASDSA